MAAEPAKPPAEESPKVATAQVEATSLQSDIPAPMETADAAHVSADQMQAEQPSSTAERLESPKKAGKKKLRKEVLFEDFDVSLMRIDGQIFAPTSRYFLATE